MKQTLFSLLLIFGLQSFASETLKGMRKDYDVFKESMKKELHEVDLKIEKLKTASKEKGQQVKASTAKDLEVAKNNLSKDLEHLQQTSSTKWQEVKKSFAESVDHLNTKVQKALND